MGGKTKQSQRTKNNARPSSSGRSVELLNNTVNLQSWKSPEGGKMALFPTLNSPFIDQSLSSEFSICVKKLNKKDPITKTKALHELTELVNNSNLDDVVLVLPSWAHYYKILAVDTDCKVRESTQACHAAIARVCGRQLAPVLRQVVPTWLQAQYDDHPPAQTHANNSLKSTFPENKLPEVISFCKTEVVTHLFENLSGSVDKAILSRIDSAEERELQQQRLVLTSLQGLRYLTQHMPDAHSDWLQDQLTPLLAGNAFWKLANHASPQIRGAWFGALGGVVRRLGRALEGGAVSRAAGALLRAADAAPPVAPPLWACLLDLMHSVPDWHKSVDKKDLLTKRILNMLEKGGWGDARRLAAMLLPLLANLPVELQTRDHYEAFFDAFYKGLEQKCILNSKSERQYWITSLSECLRYLSIQPDDYVVEVVTSVHRTWVKKTLSVERDSQLRNNLVKHSAASMAALVKYWLKQSKEPHGEKYDQMVRNFWQNVASTILAQVDQSTDVETATKVLDGHILLLQTLKTAFLNEGKKPLCIKFDGDSPTQAEKPDPPQETDATSVERYMHNLNEVVEKVCCGYFEYADKKELCESILSPLITILTEFDSEALYLALAKHFNASRAHGLYDKVLRRWMVTDTTRCKPVVDVIFILLKHLTEEEQNAVLASFDQFGWGAIEWCVSCALCHVQWRAAGVRRWLRGGTVERALLALARRLLRRRAPTDRNLLFMCLSQGAAGDTTEMLISASTASGVAREAGEALRAQLRAADEAGAVPPAAEADAPDLDHAASLSAHLVTALAALPVDDNYVRLVLDLFDLLVVVPRGSGWVSADTWCEVRSALQDGAAAARPRLLPAAAAALHARLARLGDTVSIGQIEHMVSLCPHVVFAPHADARCALHSPHLEQFSRHLMTNTSNDGVRLHAEVCALRYDCIVGKLNCVVDDNEVIKMIIEESSKKEVTDLTKKEYVVFANRLLFRAIYLRTMLLYKKDEDEQSDHDDSDSEDKEGSDAASNVQDEVANDPSPKNLTESHMLVDDLLTKDYMLEEFCDIIYEHMIVNTLYQAYGFWVHYDLIKITLEKTNTILRDIISNASDEVRLVVLEELKEKAKSIGFYWAYAKAWYQSVINEGSKALVSSQPDKLDLDSLTGNGFFHTLQADTSGQSNDAATLQVKFALMIRCLLLVHETDEAFTRQALAACNDCNLDPVIALYRQHQSSTVYERSIESLSWQAIVGEASVGAALAACVRAGGWDAAAHHWDFAALGLCELVRAVRASAPHYSTTKVNMIAWAACELYLAVSEFVGAIRAESERRLPQPHVLHLLSEWPDVYAPALTRDLFLIASDFIEKGSMEMSSGTALALEAVRKALQRAEWRHGGGEAAGLGLAALAGRAGAALARPLHPAYHGLAYVLLLRLVPHLAEYSEQNLNAWSAEVTEEGKERDPPQLATDLLQEHFTKAIELADAALSAHTAGEESCEMVAGSDAHAVVLGCLLLSEVMHQICALAKGELQHHYIQAYRENKYTESFLPVALRLIPRELLSLALQHNSHAALPAAYTDYFQRPLVFKSDEGWWWKRGVETAACRGVFTSLAGPGAGGARGWRGAAGRAGRGLARLVAAYVAPALVRRQLDLLHHSRADLEDTEVTVLWAANEAMVVYRVEDRPVELWVKFEADFPLSLPRITAPTVRPSVNTNWISMYIAYQNGTVLSAVRMWSAALSSRVEGAAQCYVCYCRLHPASGHLPQVRCHTCRNSFHNACIHKWFVSSHKSNCPLCRSNF